MLRNMGIDTLMQVCPCMLYVKFYKKLKIKKEEILMCRIGMKNFIIEMSMLIAKVLGSINFVLS